MLSRETDRNGGTLDIQLTAVLAVLAAVTLVVPVEEPTVLRAAAGLPLLLFLPGYALVSALFPAKSDGASTRVRAATRPERGAISTVERIVLAMVASVAVVGISAILANAVVGVHLLPILAIVVAITLLTSLFAYTQQLQLPQRQRFSPLQSLAGPTGPGLPTSATGWVLLVAVVLSLFVVAASGVAAVGPDGDGVTEFYVGGETENGTIAMGEQATNLTVGESATHYVVVEQRQPDPANYTVVARLVDGADGTAGSELGRYEMNVGATGHAVQAVDVTLNGAGTDQRVEYLLYEGDAPAEPRADTALRSLSFDMFAEES